MPSRAIEDLHLQLQSMTRDLLRLGQEAIANTGYTFFITDGFRSIAEQNELYAQGRTKPGKIVTNAKGGESAHNYGLAVDCAFQKGGTLFYNADLYARIYPIARSLGFELGADWTGFVDKPHFEHPQWEKIAKGQVITPPISVPGEPSMATLFEYLGVSNEAEARNKLREHLGEENDKCNWGKEPMDGEVNMGGFLGGERREIKRLRKQLESQVIDTTKWEENGMLIETTRENVKTTINYQRRKA